MSGWPLQCPRVSFDGVHAWPRRRRSRATGFAAFSGYRAASNFLGVANMALPSSGWCCICVACIAWTCTWMCSTCRQTDVLIPPCRISTRPTCTCTVERVSSAATICSFEGRPVANSAPSRPPFYSSMAVNSDEILLVVFLSNPVHSFVVSSEFILNRSEHDRYTWRQLQLLNPVQFSCISALFCAPKVQVRILLHASTCRSRFKASGMQQSFSRCFRILDVDAATRWGDKALFLNPLGAPPSIAAERMAKRR